MRNKVKILVVEDETPVAMLMVHILTRVGCDVVAAHTGHKGLELAGETKFDLITLDIDLPDVSGFDLCSELKQRHISHRTPIVFITGRPCEENRQRSLEIGAADCITKPFEPDDFIFRIISLIKAGKHRPLLLENEVVRLPPSSAVVESRPGLNQKAGNFHPAMDKIGTSERRISTGDDEVGAFQRLFTGRGKL